MGCGTSQEASAVHPTQPTNQQTEDQVLDALRTELVRDLKAEVTKLRAELASVKDVRKKAEQQAHKEEDQAATSPQEPELQQSTTAPNRCD